MNKLTPQETELKEQLKSLLNNDQLSNREQQLLQAALNSVDEGVYYNRVVFDLKNELSSLILEGGASESVVNFMSELSRLEPTSGPSSIWNRLIKR
jgi:DNA-directed RNA polymerase specialized sigma54-like protein